MKRYAILALLSIATAHAEAGTSPESAPRLVPPAPPGVCVPAQLLSRMTAYTARQPWADVTNIMDGLRSMPPNGVPCSLELHTDPAPTTPAN